MQKLPSLLAFGLAAAAVLGSVPAEARQRITPLWSLIGNYSLAVPPGVASLAGTYTFPLSDGTANINLGYDLRSSLQGSGTATNSAGITIYSLAGYFTGGLGTEHRVHLADPAKKPLFSFDGVATADGADIVGTFQRLDGYLGIAGSELGQMTMHRQGPPSPTSFKLDLVTRMDDLGHVRGAIATDGKTVSKAKLAMYGGITLENGKISGLVRTDVFGVTTGKVKIVGPKWRVRLYGPIDDTGFHASCEVIGAGWHILDIPLTLPVLAGPVGPPPPPPPPPKNLLTNATATVQGGQVHITHNAVPSKFFGVKAALSIEFPTADGISVVTADPSDASTATPRRCIVTIGSTTYGTATAPASVTFDIRKLSTVRDGVIEVLASGKVVAPNGRSKTVDVLVQAVVQ